MQQQRLQADQQAALQVSQSLLEPQDQAIVDVFNSDIKVDYEGSRLLRNLFGQPNLHIDRIVAHIGNINSINPEGKTLLDMAVQEGVYKYKIHKSDNPFLELSYINTLLEMGADPLTTEHSYNITTTCQNLEILSLLLKHSKAEEKKVALCSKFLCQVFANDYVTLSERSSILNLLLNNGVNPNYQDEFGVTVLHNAIFRLRTDSYNKTHNDLELLILNGGKMDNRSNLPEIGPMKGLTPETAGLSPLEYVHQNSEHEFRGLTPLEVLQAIRENEQHESKLYEALHLCDNTKFETAVQNGDDISGGKFVKDVILHSFLFDPEPLKILIRLGRLVIDPDSLADMEVDILAKNIVEVQETIPMASIIDEPIMLNIKFKTHLPGAPPPTPEAMARMAPITDIIRECNATKRDAVHAEVSSSISAPDNIVDLINQFAGVPLADQVHMDRFNKQKQVKQKEGAISPMPAASPSSVAPASSAGHSQHASSSFDQTTLDAAFKITKEAKSALVREVSEIEEVSSPAAFPSATSRRGSVNSDKSSGRG